MNNCFVSVISLVAGREQLRDYLVNVHAVLDTHFSDFEIILIDNGAPFDCDRTVLELAENVRRNVYLIRLSKKIDPNNALVAGLDRANGDYTVLFDMQFRTQPELILGLYAKTQEDFDIVYVRYEARHIPLHKRALHKLFYFLMNRYSDLAIDPNMHESRVISRRALNSILEVRDSLRYTKGILSSVGYKTACVEVDSVGDAPSERFSDQFASAVVALTSFTDIPGKLLMYIFLASVIFCSYTITDALFVRFFGHDVFGAPQVRVPGFTFLVVLISVIFVLLTLMLYILSTYIISLNHEIKNRPVYIVESYKRY